MIKELLIEKLVTEQRSLFYFAISLTHDKEAADDLLQETSLKVLSNVDKLKYTDNIKNWMFTIMRNIFITDYRKYCEQHSMPTEQNELIIENLNTLDQSPDNVLACKEIETVIERLETIYRIPMGLYIKGYKYEEIAQQINIPIGTVKSRIHTSRRLIKKEIIDEKKER